MGRIFTIGLLMASLSLPVWLSVPASEYPAELKKWLDSPVRYVATPPEIKAFKKLKTDNARAAFIESFWARRDPEPDTLVNEYRQAFWERVRETSDLFYDGAKPGWKTDRGKIYILYGPPTKIEDDLHAQVAGSAQAGHGILRWIYEGSEKGRKDINPVAVVVPFIRDATGEYRLSADPRLASEKYALDDILDRSAYEEWLQTDVIVASRSPLAVMLDMGRMQTIPRQEELLLARVDTMEVYGDDQLPVAVHRYRGPDGHGTVLTLTIAVPVTSADPRAAILARLVPVGIAESPIVLGEGSFLLEGEGEGRLAQGRVVVAPGTYELTVLVVVPGTSRSAVYRGPVVIDPPSSELHMSDVALAQRLERVRYDAMASYTQPYTVGSFHVVPRIDPRIEPGQELSLFYEVYGGERPYRVTYQIDTWRDSGWAAASRPVVQEGGEGAQGWSVPTSEAWPFGRYRVRIEIEDAQGATRNAEVDFDLAPPDAG